jgi:hypothetical protein
MNSRAKGQRGERELADFLTAAGFPARRGQQFAGGQDSPDVVCPGLPFHIEAKRTECLNLEAAISQADRDAGGRKPWAVFHRRNRTGWRVTLDAAAFLALARAAQSQESLSCYASAVSTLTTNQNATTGQPDPSDDY